MTLIAVPPGLAFAEAEWTLASPFQDNRSKWTGARRGAALPGAAHWTATLEISGIRIGHAAAAPIRAFLAALKGSANSFRVPAAINQHELSVAPTVKAGALAGTINLTVQGLPASAQHLAAGYYMTVIRPNGVAQMLILTAPLIANGTGEALASFEPPLIQAPAAGSPAETRSPFCEVTRVQSEASWKQARNNAHSFRSIDVEEVV